MKILSIIAAALMFVSCGKNAAYTTLDGFAEGTTYHIVYQDPQGRDLTAEITDFFQKFDKSLSIYDSASIVSRLNAADTTVVLDDWFVECFDMSQLIARQSGGLLDVTLRPLISAYGFGEKAGMSSVTDAQVDSMLAFVGYEKVKIVDRQVVKQDSRLQLDFNAIAKGYSVDLIAQMIEQKGIENYLVEVGGEIFSRGVNAKGNPWVVAIDTPFEGNYTPGADTRAILKLSGAGLATSGNYRKFRLDENGHPLVHTIDPRTGRPSIHTLLSATIIAPSCAVADGFATACMVAGLEGAKKMVIENSELEALFIYSEAGQMKIYATDKMQQRILSE